MPSIYPITIATQETAHPASVDLHEPGPPGDPQYSAEVQQRAHTAAIEHDRQYTDLAGTTAKRPAAPLVRDEEASRSPRGICAG